MPTFQGKWKIDYPAGSAQSTAKERGLSNFNPRYWKELIISFRNTSEALRFYFAVY